MMKIGIIDADLIGRKQHRFPNLACMKISGYHKERNDTVIFLESYELLDKFDRVYISKVFTDTPVPDHVLERKNVVYGGTGFYFDNAPPLPEEIEHSKPDYTLYNQFVRGKPKSEVKFYTDYSIGFLTRGCFRKCKFCVNQKYDRVVKASPLSEFYDPDRKKICLLDDNFLGFPDWESLIEELRATGKPFRFHQGLDERILTDRKCKWLFSSKYDGDITFAFDDVADYKLIEKKLKMIRRHTDKQIRFYVLCAFDRNNEYDSEFWKQDFEDIFERVDLLTKHKAIPYLMRFEAYENAPIDIKGMYITLARWVNQPSFFKRYTVFEYIEKLTDNGERSPAKYLDGFRTLYPDLVERWFNRHFWEVDK